MAGRDGGGTGSRGHKGSLAVKMGVLVGFPDLGVYSGLRYSGRIGQSLWLIEFKAPGEPPRLKPWQREVHAQLRAEGYTVSVMNAEE